MSPDYPDNDDTYHPPTDDLDVRDISEAWLAKMEMERRRTAMEEIKRLAAESEQIFPPDFGKTVNDTRQRALIKTKELLQFVASNPSNQLIQRRLDDIFETIQYATGISETIPSVLKVLDFLLLPLEQLGEWKRVEPWLMKMLPMLASKAPKDVPRWQRMMLQHCRYTGLRNRLDGAIENLLEEKQIDPYEHRLLILLRSTSTDEECQQIARELLEIAHDTRDYGLMMDVYSYQARRFLEKYEFELAFEQAQQAFCLAALLHDGRQLAITASYMASVFHQYESDAHKAIPYLELAMLHAEAIHDIQRLNHVRIIWGLCYHALREHQKAAAILEASLPNLDPSGIFYGRALYVWCAAMSYLEPTPAQFQDIEEKLVQANSIFEQERSPADILNGHMALIQIYLDQGKVWDARHHFEESMQFILEEHSAAISAHHRPYIDALIKKLETLDDLSA